MASARTCSWFHEITIRSMGDALGFRRGWPKPTEAASIVPHLLHTTILSYDDALTLVESHGFTLWDIVASSKREGSLDGNIRGAKYNNLPEFIAKHPSIRNIVCVSGATTAKELIKGRENREFVAGRCMAVLCGIWWGLRWYVYVWKEEIWGNEC